jgi:hypothetical protein
LIKTGQAVDNGNANIAALTSGLQLAGILMICAASTLKQNGQLNAATG